ncbi:hypothetical protein SAMN04488020_10687 [Palleronia marisminoris]|uniref:Oligosaccharide repeat unit polymerase n=1 Tax=Palleronia marisminoris TaxID=315423 RepID=A0A1Y5SY82_9RHOB|nr:hypothetical protein [Palleronia marisminoris]SFH05966.1 hypothetical protein SAMN04488020_10687 [Palleronia marisminoris]SLN51009.1 hypothetical protein PAM7066_02320 [Palleronia marisminoris]
MLKFYNIWVLSVLALFYFGPIDWPGADRFAPAAVVLSCLGLFNLGSAVGERCPALPARGFDTFVDRRAAWWLGCVFLALTALHVQDITGRFILDPTAYSLAFGDVYSSYLTRLDERQSGAIAMLVTVAKAVVWPMIFLLIVASFRRNTKLLLFLIFPYLASSMMRGTDKETVDLAIFFLILSYYHRVLGRRVVIALGVVAFILMLFAARKMGRYDGIDFSCLPGSPDACFDFDNALSVYVSPSLEFLRITLTNYLTQGYEGLARATELPMRFGWFIGHMPPLQSALCSTVRVACEMSTYIDRLPDHGWDTSNKWASVYTVLATDFHWVLMPFYFFVWGIVFAVSEKSWLQNRDQLSLGCLLLVAMMIIYSSANMQLAISLDWIAIYLLLFGCQVARILSNRPQTAGAQVSSIRVPNA